MEAFYEESAVNHTAKSGETKYRVLHIFSVVFIILAVLFLIFSIFNIPNCFYQPETEEQAQMLASQKTLFALCVMQTLFFGSMWFVFNRLKARTNVSYDYCFVSGELRISKVVNVNRRKLFARIDCENMLQIGDVDNPSYERFRADPTIKELICTPNEMAEEGKFFMYVYANYEGKKLFVLECRELLLMNILKFVKRSVLESDYVMQEKKNKYK